MYGQVTYTLINTDHRKLRLRLLLPDSLRISVLITPKDMSICLSVCRSGTVLMRRISSRGSHRSGDNETIRCTYIWIVERRRYDAYLFRCIWRYRSSALARPLSSICNGSNLSLCDACLANETTS